MKLAIDKGVPLPPSRSYDVGLSHTLRKLDIGDSVFVHNGKQRPISAIGCVIGKRSNMKFATRTVEGGVRIWRVE